MRSIKDGITSHLAGVLCRCFTKAMEAYASGETRVAVENNTVLDQQSRRIEAGHIDYLLHGPQGNDIHTEDWQRHAREDRSNYYPGWHDEELRELLQKLRIS